MEGICEVGSSKNDSATLAQWQMEKHTHTLTHCSSGAAEIPSEAGHP